MYYTEKQVNALAQSLRLSPVAERLVFFEECLRLRQRERNLWTDTPVAKIFTDESEWHLMQARSAINKLGSLLASIAADGGSIGENKLVRLFGSPAQQEQRAKQQHMAATGESKSTESSVANRHLQHTWTPSDLTIAEAIYHNFDEDKDGRLSVEDMHRMCIALNLKFEVVDCVAMVRLIDTAGDEKVSREEFAQAFAAANQFAHLPADCAVGEALVDSVDFWTCPNCAFMNAAINEVCVMCQCDWTGQRGIPRDHWVCIAPPGCTKLNHDSKYYCEICGLSRPDLSSMRF